MYEIYNLKCAFFSDRLCVNLNDPIEFIVKDVLYIYDFGCQVSIQE